MKKKLLIKGIISNNSSSIKSDLLINEDKIENINSEYHDKNSDVNLEIFDCTGCYIIPGVIDTHVHLRDLEQFNKESIKTGTLAAINGGITTVLSMPNTVPKLTSKEVYDEYKKRAQLNMHANIGVYCGIGNGFKLENLDNLQKEGIFGLKIYPGDSSDDFELKWDYVLNLAENYDNKHLTEEINLNYFISIAEKEFLRKNTPDFTGFENWVILFEKCFELNLPILLHPDIPIKKEKREELFKNYKVIGIPNLKAHSLIYNKAHELLHNIFIFKILDILGKKYQPKNSCKIPKLVFCHVSCPESVDLLEKLRYLLIQKYSSIDVKLEVTPHHLFLNYDISQQNDQYGKVLQPLRAEKDSKKMKFLLKNNKFSFIATDHAPHTIEEKNLEFLQAPSGISGLDAYVLYILTKIFQGFIRIEDFVKLACYNPAEFYSIGKRGEIKPGYFADIVVIEKTAPYSLSISNFYSKAKFSPYNLENIEAKIKYVFLSGKLVVDNTSKAKLIQENPMGCFIKKSN